MYSSGDRLRHLEVFEGKKSQVLEKDTAYSNKKTGVMGVKIQVYGSYENRQGYEDGLRKVTDSEMNHNFEARKQLKFSDEFNGGRARTLIRAETNNFIDANTQ